MARATYGAETGINPQVEFDARRPPYETYKALPTGGGLMGEPTPAPTAPTQAGTNPPPATVTPPTGPMPTVPPGGVAPTPVPAPTQAAPTVTPPVAGPDPNWQVNVQRPAGQTLPPPPVTPSAPNIPPASQAITYSASGPLGTNSAIGQNAPVAGLGAATVGDFRGVFNEGDRDAVTRTVQANELSGNQLNDLIRGNSQYIQNARLSANEQSAERGMLMSSIAAGASQRAAIDAAQPFAMQQADAYGRAASENMQAQNADAQADQGQFRDLGARDIALRAQMEDASLGRQFQGSLAQNEQAWRSGESYLDRQFQQGENAANRNFQSSERAASQNWQSGESAYDRAWRGDQASLDRYQQTSERLGAQDFASGETAYDRAWREYQAGLDRAQQTNERYGSQDFQRSMSEDEQSWRSGEATLDRNYNATQAEANRNESRYGTYFNMIANREQQLATVLNGIYSNPNLTPAQQQQAATNARAVLGSVTDGYNAVMSNGIPPIFANPYPMQFSGTAPAGATNTGVMPPANPDQYGPVNPNMPAASQPVPWRNLNGIAAP